MATRPVTIDWRGLTVSADVYSEPDPMSSSGKKLYDVNNLMIREVFATAAERLILETFDQEIREAILETVK